MQFSVSGAKATRVDRVAVVSVDWCTKHSFVVLMAAARADD